MGKEGFESPSALLTRHNPNIYLYLSHIYIPPSSGRRGYTLPCIFLLTLPQKYDTVLLLYALLVKSKLRFSKVNVITPFSLCC